MSHVPAEHDPHHHMGDMIGSSPKMRRIYELICRIADTHATVLISGESGTGKELIARAIHQQSQRRSKPFIAVNCAAISEQLLESELFGHERGAFTGATDKHLGKFELAHTGVLFLDEIGNLHLDLQAKLLRVLQEREFERVGGSKTIRVDVRIVAASNRNLKQMVAEQTFRDDLFYRLNVIRIQVPPLRERRTDIPLFIDHFLAYYNTAFERQVQRLTPAALAVLRHYPWPGNVRELEHAIERLVAISPKRVIDIEDLPFDLVTDRHRVAHESLVRRCNLRQAKAEFERHYILRVLEQCRWNQTETAKMLGIHRNTLLGKMETLHLRSSPEIDVPAAAAAYRK